jgi:serine/threonine protein kinase
MGAHSSCFEILAPPPKDRKKRPRLTTNYSVGRELGRGSFALVNSCTSKSSGQERAVKRVGRHLCSEAAINQEIGMLRKLAHPSVVELHTVYHGKFTVDLVFSLYRGGNMLDGAVLHWRSKGAIPTAAVRNLCRQVFDSLAWLHRNNVVHRDVKGENYLLDRVELEHPDCCVRLGDLGFVAELGRQEERLTEQCGTEVYWAPEVYKKSYGLKVDVWAAGVITHALLTRRFPYGDNDEARAEIDKVPSSRGQACVSFLDRALARSEDDRFAASAALEHVFLAELGSASEEIVEGHSVKACDHSQVKELCSDGGAARDAEELGRSASFKSEAATALPSSSASLCAECDDMDSADSAIDAGHALTA